MQNTSVRCAIVSKAKHGKSRFHIPFAKDAAAVSRPFFSYLSNNNSAQMFEQMIPSWEDALNRYLRTEGIL